MNRFESGSHKSGLASLDLLTEYRTGHVDPAAEFYNACLRNSVKYRRAVGFFRSTVYLVVGPATVDFARRGGRIQLICSPSLTDEDVESLEAGYSERLALAEGQIAQEIDRLLASEVTEYRTKVLATLVAVGAMEIRIALRPTAYGLYHEKIGIFKEADGESVSFIGSANETWNGWHRRGNFESIEVFCSWRGGREAERVRRHDDYFELLWSGNIPDVEVAPFPEVARQRLIQSAYSSLEDVDTSLLEGRPHKRTPLPHQISAIESWKACGNRGIFSHATGSGKTYTALLAIKEHVEAGLPALVLVPSRLLLDQWAAEIREEMPNTALLLAGGGNDRWKQGARLRAMTSPSRDLGARVVLSTMQTAATDVFMLGIVQGDHLMVVADEVHQVGSTFNSRVMLISTGPRIGLSATPIRYGDPEGTAKIFDYFGKVVPPAITLQDAIKAGRLVEYEYYPHLVHLTDDEAEQWRLVTHQIRQEIARQKESEAKQSSLSEKAKLLLIQRSRIAKKASRKPQLVADLMHSHYEPGQRWLIYCEDSEQLNEVLHAIRSIGLQPVEYHSGMQGDRDATLAWFRTFGGVLVSIRCLDEGVDIPAVSHALIVASSQNPRQFIQRRGRVLRKSYGKTLAVIHDVIVVPVSLEDEPDQIALLRAELLRAIQFSESAINRSSGAQLRIAASRLGIDANEFGDQGVEEEE